MLHFDSGDDYLRQFSEKNILEQALTYAVQERRFEIELYWKRATYSWALLGGVFVAYFAVATSDSIVAKELIQSVIGWLGLLVSTAWYLINRGSKFWQEHWEQKVELLENEIIGPVYKTASVHSRYSFVRLLSAYPYSVTRINTYLSLIVCVVWCGLTALPWTQEWLVEKDSRLTSLLTYVLLPLFVVTLVQIIAITIASPERDVSCNVRVRRVLGRDGTRPIGN